MSLKEAIKNLLPVGYWPLDDATGATDIADDCNHNPGTISKSCVTLATIPFGQSMMPSFDGNCGSFISIPDDDRYSAITTGTLTVACWACPLALDFVHTDGSRADQRYVHIMEKGVDYKTDVEWSFRLLNENSTKPSRLAFNQFKKGPAELGAGAYMQYGVSANDHFPVEVGRWMFLVGQSEQWTSEAATKRGSLFFKQGVLAKRTSGDKYKTDRLDVQPHNSVGPITIGGSLKKTWFRGAVGHIAIWDRLLSEYEVKQIWDQGLAELRSTPMYQSY